jgi:predicted N-formylglutamate amidohydrolase
MADSEANEYLQAVEIVEGRLDCGLLLICDHASNAVPPELERLGLAPDEFLRHIAYDIGAAEVTRALAGQLQAPAILSGFSRLVIDPNRGADDPTLVMRISDGALIPGNAYIDAAEIARRRTTYWQPYREAISGHIAAMTRQGLPPIVLSVHSFTPCWRGVPRPWHVGLLWDSDPRLARPLVEGLGREGGLIVGDNEPYDGALVGDTLDGEVTSRGLAGALIEIRQDLIAEPEGARLWSERLARIVAPLIGQAHMHEVHLRPSRTGRHGGAGMRGNVAVKP